MKRSKKYSLSDSNEVVAGIKTGEPKSLTYGGHEYLYRIDKYTMYKDYYALIVVGGRYRIRAITTCKKSELKKKLKLIIVKLCHK